ncbi:hypothetical protein BN8_03161 [Fibrisoma limi BUZ 3]|uniref:Peptidase M50 domain-containing protein n=1 Tax=Fibrisoma limi BUZ 3 TaxID=1185876 RepID=I2GJE7_9BACT|nr:M50 family metallopeptidase [Fibrisoma limi]CCH54022.1 hypothetical protein BN8_03161 [Fibrisoma limi BUZ 3]
MKNKNKVLPLLVGGLLGGLAGFAFMRLLLAAIPKETAQLLFGAPAGPGEGIAKGIVGLIGVWGGIAIHELAHLLTGLSLGFRFYLYVAGFLGVRRNPITDRVEWYVNRDPNMFGGLAGTVPVRQENNLRQKLAAVCAAGPLASLTTGALSLGLSFYVINRSALDSPLTRVMLVFGLIFGLISVLLFLATTVPSRTGPFFTDRARFFRLISGGHDAEVEQAVLELIAHSQSGLPYADLNLDQINLLTNEPEAFFRSYAHGLAYTRHLDRSEWDAAFAHIEAANDLADDQPTTFKNEIWKDLAFAQAFIRNDADAARQTWNRINPAFRQQKTAHLYLIQAAMALAERQPDQARQFVQEGLKVLPEQPVKSDDKLYKKLLVLMQERVNPLTV